jgi:hypothetical protein
MRVLVATTATQGHRSNDFNYCRDGELLRFASVCARDHGNPDGACGCARSWAGVETAKGTTTAVVADKAITVDELAEAVNASYGIDLPAEAREEAEEVCRIAGEFPVGAVLEVRGDTIQVRQVVVDRGEPAR